jgi:3' exoribonuclease, RNase T-like
VSEDGRKYYAISEEFDPTTASEWVKKNILSKLPPHPRSFNPAEASPSLVSESRAWKSREQIKQDLVDFIITKEKAKIHFWAAWADYDWVAFCWIFGKMIVDLPKGYPMYCNDIIQWMNQLGLTREFLFPKPENAHNALVDAQWVQDCHTILKEYFDRRYKLSSKKHLGVKQGSHE